MGATAGHQIILKFSKPRPQDSGQLGRPRVLSRSLQEAPRPLTSTPFVTSQPTPVGLPEWRLDPCPLSSQMGKRPISDKDKHTHSDTQTYPCMHTCIRMYWRDTHASIESHMPVGWRPYMFTFVVDIE